jgi:hypothetical protein
MKTSKNIWLLISLPDFLNTNISFTKPTSLTVQRDRSDPQDPPWTTLWSGKSKTSQPEVFEFPPAEKFTSLARLAAPPPEKKFAEPPSLTVLRDRSDPQDPPWTTPSSLKSKTSHPEVFEFPLAAPPPPHKIYKSGQTGCPSSGEKICRTTNFGGSEGQVRPAGPSLNDPLEWQVKGKPPRGLWISTGWKIYKSGQTGCPSCKVNVSGPAGWAGSVRGARNFYSGLSPPTGPSLNDPLEWQVKGKPPRGLWISTGWKIYKSGQTGCPSC